MARGAWARAMVPAILSRQVIAMGDDEEPIDPDPFKLFGDDTEDEVLPYDPTIWERIKNVNYRG